MLAIKTSEEYTQFKALRLAIRDSSRYTRVSVQNRTKQIQVLCSRRRKKITFTYITHMTYLVHQQEAKENQEKKYHTESGIVH